MSYKMPNLSYSSDKNNFLLETPAIYTKKP